MTLTIIASVIFFVIATIFDPISGILKNNYKVIKIIAWVISAIISGIALSVVEYNNLIPECQNLKVYVPLLGLCIGNALGGSIILGELINFIKANRKV